TKPEIVTSVSSPGGRLGENCPTPPKHCTPTPPGPAGPVRALTGPLQTGSRPSPTPPPAPPTSPTPPLARLAAFHPLAPRPAFPTQSSAPRDELEHRCPSTCRPTPRSRPRPGRRTPRAPHPSARYRTLRRSPHSPAGSSSS